MRHGCVPSTEVVGRPYRGPAKVRGRRDCPRRPAAEPKRSPTIPVSRDSRGLAGLSAAARAVRWLGSPGGGRHGGRLARFAAAAEPPDAALDIGMAQE